MGGKVPESNTGQTPEGKVSGNLRRDSGTSSETVRQSPHKANIETAERDVPGTFVQTGFQKLCLFGIITLVSITAQPIFEFVCKVEIAALRGRASCDVCSARRCCPACSGRDTSGKFTALHVEPLSLYRMSFSATSTPMFNLRLAAGIRSRGYWLVQGDLLETAREKFLSPHAYRRERGS